MNILLIEDNAGDARLLREMLKEPGSPVTEVMHVGSMAEAEKHISHRAFDIIVLDLGLPDVEGLEAVRRARQAAPDVPLVVLTGWDSESIAAQALQEGAQDYLVKGQIETRGLMRALRYAIERQTMEVKIANDVLRLKRAEHERRLYEQRLEKSNADLALLAGHLAQARDEAERATRAKSRFLAGMSHELRTPLTGILGYTRLLRMEGGLNPAQVARVDAMLEAGKHLLEMISCVLDLSENEAEHFELRPVALDVQAIVAACLDLIRPMAEAKGLALSMAVASDTPVQLIADPTRLRQILLNLLGNAAKFTDHGAVVVNLRTLRDGAVFRIEVVDTGLGISADQRQRLFRDFERLEIETTRKVEGAGLGLALSSRLAGVMGGNLGHEDNPGGGSVFWLELPLETVASLSPIPEPEIEPGFDALGAATALASDQKLHVLVVDDVLMNRDIAGSFLRAAGLQVTCAEGGAEAVLAAAETDFDVVLMDVRMPEMDGLEATRRIRAIEGVRGRVPIVALTAQAFTDQIQECRNAGMDGHLAKPFDPETLLVAVVQATAARRTDRKVVPSFRPITMPAAPAIPVMGSELSVLDRMAFDRTAAFLPPEKVDSYLKTLVDLGNNLLLGLRKPDALARNGDQLAAAAHTMAGSAGMLGFERVASLGRRFERAVQTASAETSALADGLSAALEATMLAARDRLSVVVGQECGLS